MPSPIARPFIASILTPISVFMALISLAMPQLSQAQPRQTQLLDHPWRFALGHPHDPARDFNHATGYFSYLAKAGFGDGAASLNFDDRAWRVVQIPHDWAVEMPINKDASPSHGYRALGPGFPDTSVGWYRHHFTVPASDEGQRIYVHFDGIQRDARVFVNGFFVGEENYGNLDQLYDVSAYLNYGGDNLIAVRADVSLEAGWYYEGAGINRAVKLIKTGPIAVAMHGTFVQTKIEKNRAIISVDTEILNRHENSAVTTVPEVAVTLEHQILDAEGRSVTRKQFAAQRLGSGENQQRRDQLTLAAPKLWDVDAPYLYTLVTRLLDGNDQLLDEYHTPFGVRSIHFDADKGFFLNGRPLKLKGSNNHEDHAGVGTATPDALIEWRLRQLKNLGMNAYRAAHAPASKALLTAADKVGILVIDETRLSGINDYHLDAVARLIKRGRNHPSVILWSLGNEEWAIEGNEKGARIAKTMQSYARKLDPTRLTTIAISGGWGGISREIGVMGVNYIRHGDSDKQHRDYPWQIILGTEETTSQQTRGIYVEDKAQGHLPPQTEGSSGGNAESGWRHYAARDYAAGVFYWTGFDYRGEPTPYKFPAISSQFGILDMAGFPKDGASYLQSVWTDKPVLHIFPHWNWPGREGEIIEVRAHSNAQAIELFLNDTSLGKQTVREAYPTIWQVPYTPGSLKAVAYRDDKIAEEIVRVTTGAATQLSAEASTRALKADGHDVAIINISAQDRAGNAHPTANNVLHFSLSGPGKIIGVGNGNPSSHEADVQVPTHQLRPLGQWQTPPAQDTQTPISFSADFSWDGNRDGALLINALGDAQTLQLNGVTLYQDAARDQSRGEWPLADLPLKKGNNHLRISAQPFAVWQDREALSRFHPAAILSITPAAPYTRHLFNGMAQVIVQTTKDAGDIQLSITSDNLEPVTLSLNSGK